jgi:hypothetical protein
MSTERMSDKMETALMDLTPAQAAEFLRNNPGNRRLDERSVELIADMIVRGEWVISHQGIALSSDGRLLDGQHRCAAVVKANRTVKVLVSFNVPDEAFPHIDRHRARSLAFTLRARHDDVALARLALTVVSGRSISRGDPWSPGQVSRALDALDVSLSELRQANAMQNKRTSAGVRLSVLCHVLAGRGEHALSLYDAFVRLDVAKFPPVMSSFHRQIVDGETSPRRDMQDFIARAYGAFDPQRANSARLQVKSSQSALDEMQTILALKVQP